MLNWVTTSSLGAIELGFISELSVSAEQTLPISEIKYSFTSGNLPAGLSLKHDGTIVGKVAYNSTGTYTFSITALDALNNEQSLQNFNLSVIDSTGLEFTEIYFRPYLSLAKRRQYSEFVNNEQIFVPSLIYRAHDINFGVQRKLKMVLDFGLEKLNLSEYTYPLYENFYRKRLRLGSIKTAIAKNSAGEHIYDVIYADVIDELVDNNNVSVEKLFHNLQNEQTYYPASVDNMRLQLQNITLQDWSIVHINENLQPRFMMTQQSTDYRTKTYMRVVPICYTLPNKSKIIANKIKANNFKFNTIDFEIDRLMIQSSVDNVADKYLLFSRAALGNQIETDGLLQGPEGWIQLDDESDQPLQRE